MENTNRRPVFQVLVALSFLLMVIVNALATLLPINGITTGEISDRYPNLFAPAGITFSIWIIIYVLLAVYVVYQFSFFRMPRDGDSAMAMTNIGFMFFLSSVANVVWIFAWHYEQIFVSAIAIAVIMLCLMIIAFILRKMKMSISERICVRLPFSIYFGWITVALIANIVALLVSIQWDQFGLSESFWTVVVLLVGAIITFSTMMFHKDFVYGLAVVWAYVGILLKHLDAKEFDGQYPAVILTVCVCAAVLFMGSMYVAIFSKLLKRKEVAIPETSAEAVEITNSEATDKPTTEAPEKTDSAEALDIISKKSNPKTPS